VPTNLLTNQIRFDPGQPGRWCRESASAAATIPPTSMSLIREELAQLTEATSKVEIQAVVT
jgi:hypothetical protein